MERIEVSVIIPTYKRSAMLGRAIDSALNQTFQQLEVIVVDDNNPDTDYRKKTEEFMSKYAANPKVRYIKHEKNKNGAAARNTGIRNAKGKYIAFLDDDDFFYPEKIRKQVNFLEKNRQYDAVYSGRIQKGRKICRKAEGDLSKEILTMIFSPPTSTLMFRKAPLLDIDGFDESFRRHQDYELLLKFFHKYTIGAISEPLMEMGENEGENELHGDELEANKRRFLTLFAGDIKRLDNLNPGFKKNVYLAHYRAVFCDHLSMKDFKRAWTIYKKGCRISFVKFNYSVVSYVIYYIKVKIQKRRNQAG